MQAHVSDTERLYKNLFREYERDVGPYSEHSPVRISFGMSLQYAEFERDELLRTNVWLVMVSAIRF